MAYLTKEEYLNIYKRFMEKRIDDMEGYVNSCMVNDGDTEETSQRICILNKIRELEAAVNGVEIEDLIISEDK